MLQSGLSIGSRGDFTEVEGLHAQAAETARRAVELLSAPRIASGEHWVVLDPILAGVFVHEAFGHLSEADFTYENERMREIMVLGRRFGADHLNIVDGAAVPGLRGSYRYDDEGVPASRTYLVREGVLVGRLHSRETAAKMAEPVSNPVTLEPAAMILDDQVGCPLQQMQADDSLLAGAVPGGIGQRLLDTLVRTYIIQFLRSARNAAKPRKR